MFTVSSRIFWLFSFIIFFTITASTSYFNEGKAKTKVKDNDLSFTSVDSSEITNQPQKPSLNLQFNTKPESVHMDSEVLNNIDRVIKNAMAHKAMPGCQVLVARKNNVIFHKAYGYQTYSKRIRITDSTLYDVASLTKVLVTVPLMMQLVASNKIDLHEKIVTYLPDLKHTNKEHITVRQVLFHHGGLSPHMPGWFETFHTDSLFKKFYQSTYSKTHPIHVAKNVYAPKNHEDSLWKWVKQTPLLSKNKRGVYAYKYSDLGFYILTRICRKVTQKSINHLFTRKIARPLGLQRMTFLPLDKFPISEIAPSGNDPYFRKQILHGFVHDYAAAMIGGVSGHAGIFSNATDIAMLMQVFLQKGNYKGKKHFDSATIQQFTSPEYSNSHRGLGWDKPRSHGKYNPASNYASDQTFGHLGFTGTCVWVDPKYELIYVFLSNCHCPKYKNWKLQKMKIRQKVHDIIYQSIR